MVLHGCIFPAPTSPFYSFQPGWDPSQSGVYRDLSVVSGHRKRRFWRGEKYAAFWYGYTFFLFGPGLYVCFLFQIDRQRDSLGRLAASLALDQRKKCRYPVSGRDVFTQFYSTGST